MWISLRKGCSYGAVITKPEDLGLLTEINHDQQEFMQEVAHTNEELAAGYKKV